MNISEMRVNKDALDDWLTTAAINLNFGLIRIRILTSIFSKTVVDKAKRFAPMKTTIQEQFGWFLLHSKN